MGNPQSRCTLHGCSRNPHARVGCLPNQLTAPPLVPRHRWLSSNVELRRSPRQEHAQPVWRCGPAQAVAQRRLVPSSSTRRHRSRQPEAKLVCRLGPLRRAWPSNTGRRIAAHRPLAQDVQQRGFVCVRPSRRWRLQGESEGRRLQPSHVGRSPWSHPLLQVFPRQDDSAPFRRDLARRSSSTFPRALRNHFRRGHAYREAAQTDSR
mmetsp:Transcript_32321/g.89289  ORF Transcript_32321/g.89289 Transcript_32321/m.89289 type:complete len:207 (-) Transcript_32321:154-774(-)